MSAPNAPTPASEVFRTTALGRSLTDALDEMIQSGHIPGPLAVKALERYDKIMTEAIARQVKAKTTIKGHLHTYRSVDDVWNFTITNAVLKLEGAGGSANAAGGNGAGAGAGGSGPENVNVDKIKIVASKGAPLP